MRLGSPCVNTPRERSSALLRCVTRCDQRLVRGLRVAMVTGCLNFHSASCERGRRRSTMIRKLKTGGYRLYSRKKNPKTGRRRNLGTFKSLGAAEKHERAVQFFKRH